MEEWRFRFSKRLECFLILDSVPVLCLETIEIAFVHRAPTVSVYRPSGVPAKDLEEILFSVDDHNLIDVSLD